MRNICLGLAFATALAATALPAAANTQQGNRSAEQRARADNADQGDRMICMRVELSNSRVARRICRTESEWRARGELEDRAD